MKTLGQTMIDHLGNDFESQGLIERKRRIDAQIEEHTRILFECPLTDNAVTLVTNTLVHLLSIQKDYASKIRFIGALSLN